MWLSKKIIIWGSIASAITGILGFIFLVLPDLKPEPHRPPPTMGAELTDLSLEYGVNHAEYLRSKGLAATPSDFNETGVIIHFTAKIAGFKGEKCQVWGSVYDSQAVSKLFDLPEGRNFTSDADEDRASSELWVPSPVRKGAFFVRLELYDPKNTRLTYKDSGVFYVH